MAEIAIISQDFCTIQELRSQEIPIDFKSTSPIVIAQYTLGPKTSEMQTYNYGSGFLRKISTLDQKTGSLKISKVSPDQSTNYSEVFLDMDNNRIINLGDADIGGPGEDVIQAFPPPPAPQGTLHHAVNLRVGDGRYLRKQAWAPENERTMFNDLLFDGTHNLSIKTTSPVGKLTLSGGYDNNRAKIELDAQQVTINLLTDAGGTINQTAGIINAAANAINTTASEIVNQANSINNIAGSVGFTGNIRLNDDLTKTVSNLKSYEYSEIEPVGGNLDYHAINIRDFKRHQRSLNVAGSDTTNSVNVYKQTVNGVHEFRRIRGGTNINVTLEGDEVVINNTASLAATIDATGLSNNDIITRLNQLFPPSGFAQNTLLRVILEYPNSGTVGPLSIVVNSTLNLKNLYSIGGRLIGSRLEGGITATGSVPSSSQPVYSVQRVNRTYQNTNGNWVLL